MGAMGPRREDLRRAILTELAVLLLTLHNSEKGELNMSQFVEESGLSKSSVYYNMLKLEKFGLISSRELQVFPRQRLVKLTEKGRRIAEKLAELDDVLRELGVD